MSSTGIGSDHMTHDTAHTHTTGADKILARVAALRDPEIDMTLTVAIMCLVREIQTRSAP